MFIKFSFSILLLFCLIESSHSWDQSELEIFDLAEEVGRNFYDVLEVSQVISKHAEIKIYFFTTALYFM